MSLEKYLEKRDFSKTSEPHGKVTNKNKHLFVIQKHAASHLHYDFRLELAGVLKSWAVPKGPNLDPKVKRLAIHVEDHPLDYADFEGCIPKGQYGAGWVIVWDKGLWKSLDENPLSAYQKGHLRFILEGEKLSGRWDLFKIDDKNSWFLKKYDDEAANTSENILEDAPESVLSGYTIEDLPKHWKNGKVQKKISKKIKLDLPSAPMFHELTPQLATLTNKTPEGDDWIFEIKFDGYRMLSFKEDKNVLIKSRNKLDWTQQFQTIAQEIKKLPISNLILDGEVVILDGKNRSNFQLLQNSIDLGENANFIYYVFDLLYYDQWDLRVLSLLERKKILKGLIENMSPLLRYSDHIEGNGKEVFKRTCEFNLEGLIAKKIDSIYETKRSKTWLKVKCTKRQEFVIGGFTPPKGNRRHFGSLFLGIYNQKGELEFVSNVGTGFSEASLTAIYAELKKRITTKNPFNTRPPGVTTAIWVKPELVGEVEFTEWTSENGLRHPSFKGLRLDKNSKDIHKELETPLRKIKKEIKKESSIILTNPQKILYPEDEISKKDLFKYYQEVGLYMLPYIQNRLLTLVRCPHHREDCFFQKHLNKHSSPYLHPKPIETKKDHHIEQYIYLNDPEGILALVQMGVLEIHMWGSTIEHLSYPDLFIFDLDPAPDVKWEEVVNAAFQIKGLLANINLESFVKTTGGKGLHLVVPIKPEHSWEVIKNFTHTFANTLEQAYPDKYVSKMTKSKRVGKIFVDYLRNQWDATAIAPFSTRARPWAPVSVPLDWDELTFDPQDTFYTIFTLPKRLSQLKKDAWEGFWKIGQKQSLNVD